MPKHSNTYTIIFVSIVAVVSSLLLSIAATSLKEKQLANIAFDKKKNILKVFGVVLEGMSQEKISSFFENSVKGYVVNSKGDVIEGKDPNIINATEERKKTVVEERRYPLYTLEQEGRVAAYAIPISGKGLWSTLYGYLSLEEDLNKVRGITFYKHGETPGLGAEISSDWFQNNFKGKKILDEKGNLVSISVVKGSASTRYSNPEKLSHYVDGISGATITSRGVTRLLKEWLETYESCFQVLKKQ